MSNIPPVVPQPALLDVVGARERVGGHEALQQMLPMLQDMLERDGPLITQALAQGDVPAAGKLLHSLKGCMPLFCFPPLCDAVAQTEQMCKTASAEVALAAYAPLEPQLLQLQGEIRQYRAM